MEFVLYDNFATEDIRAVVVTASGEETEIQVDFITEDDMGAVFLHDIEQALGGDLAQPYEVHVYGAGQLAFGAAFAADGTMTPIEAEEFIPFEDWAEVATWRVYTDQNATVVESLVTEDGGVPSPIDAELTVAPQHGTVEIGGTSFGYTPEKDFLGTDTFTVVMTANGVISLPVPEGVGTQTSFALAPRPTRSRSSSTIARYVGSKNECLATAGVRIFRGRSTHRRWQAHAALRTGWAIPRCSTYASTETRTAVSDVG